VCVDVCVGAWGCVCVGGWVGVGVRTRTRMCVGVWLAERVSGRVYAQAQRWLRLDKPLTVR
jgi:hypothetical protein